MELLASFRTTIQVDSWHKIPFHFSQYSSHEGPIHTIRACMDQELRQYPGFLRTALPLMHWFTLNNFDLAIVMTIYGCTLSPKKQTKQMRDDEPPKSAIQSRISYLEVTHVKVTSKNAIACACIGRKRNLRVAVQDANCRMGTCNM